MEDKIEVKEISDIERKIYINITPETVNQKIDDFFNNVKKEAQAPGFRKGKAPISVLKKYYKNQALGAISQMLISEFYQKSLREYNINPVSIPKIENSNNKSYQGFFDDDNSYSVEIAIEVLPKIDPIGYSDIVLNLSDNTDNIFEEKTLQLRTQFSEREQILEGSANFGDSIIIDYEIFLEKEPIINSNTLGFFIESLGQGTLIPGFEEQLIGININDTCRIKSVFPQNFNVKHLAGKEAEFNVTIKNIVRKKLADVDEDLAIIAGYETVEDLIHNLREEAEKVNTQAQRQEAEKIITSTLIEKNEFKIPKFLIEKEKNRALEQKISLNEPIEKYAIRNVKRAILLDAIYQKEDDIEIEPDEMNEFLDEQAQMYNIDRDVLISELNNTNQLDIFLGVLRGRKVVDFIINMNNNQKEEEIEDGRE